MSTPTTTGVVDVPMPLLSDAMEEGTVLAWLKADGDPVARGDELVEIETDKATMVHEAEADGILRIVAEAGDTLAVGALIARIEGGGAGEGGPAAPASATDGSSAATGGGAATTAVGGAGPGSGPGTRATGTATAAAAPALSAADAAVPASPLARRLAAALGIPLVGLAGRGPGGRVTAGDVRDQAGLSAPAGPVPSAPAGVSASPVARRMAARAGVDLTSLRGSGPRGRIVKLDVQAALDAALAVAPPATAPSAGTAAPGTATSAPNDGAAGGPESAKGTTTVVAPSRAQQVVARRMHDAKSTVPEFTVSSDVEMGACVELRARLKRLAAEGASVPSYNDMVVKAVALALREHPRVNGAYRDGAFELYSRVNVGVAVAAGDGLVVPTVFDADTTPLAEIASRGRALIEAVRAARITPAELSGGTFTVSNLGMFGVTHFTAVLNVPQAAILAVGALEPRPVVRDGALVAGHAMSLTLTCDHRIVYGADAARFLARVRQLLEEPLALLV